MSIIIRDLTKTLGDTKVLDGISLEAKKGRITAILGPNGSGKSTLLNILAGVIPQDSGSYVVENSGSANFSLMHQNYRGTLLPWRRCVENITLPLEIRGIGKNEAKKKAEDMQRLSGYILNLNKYPYQMSGGEQQLIAFYRSVVTNPSVLFLDEPFSALDYDKQLRMRDALQRYHLRSNGTILTVTHNIEEAVYLADEIVILSQKPTRVLGTVKNPLPYPRTIEVMKSRRFHDLESEVTALVRSAVV